MTEWQAPRDCAVEKRQDFPVATTPRPLAFSRSCLLHNRGIPNIPEIVRPQRHCGRGSQYLPGSFVQSGGRLLRCCRTVPYLDYVQYAIVPSGSQLFFIRLRVRMAQRGRRHFIIRGSEFPAPSGAKGGMEEAPCVAEQEKPSSALQENPIVRREVD